MEKITLVIIALAIFMLVAMGLVVYGTIKVYSEEDAFCRSQGGIPDKDWRICHKQEGEEYIQYRVVSVEDGYILTRRVK